MVSRRDLPIENMAAVGILGFGRLGGSLARGIVHPVLTYQRRDAPIPEGVHALPSNVDVARHADAIILSCKPGQIRDICTEIQPVLHPDIPIISAAAAVPLSSLRQWLPHSNHVIRCMPNIPCRVGSGVIPYYSEKEVEMLMSDLFQPNRVCRLTTEREIDISTVVTGCAPAFLAWFISHLEAIGASLDPETRNTMITATLIGTGQVLQTTSSHDLIREVASPNGATEAALASMHAASPILRTALMASIDRIDAIAHTLK